jgi:hypothetical protein
MTRPLRRDRRGEVGRWISIHSADQWSAGFRYGDGAGAGSHGQVDLEPLAEPAAPLALGFAFGPVVGQLNRSTRQNTRAGRAARRIANADALSHWSVADRRGDTN